MGEQSKSISSSHRQLFVDETVAHNPHLNETQEDSMISVKVLAVNSVSGKTSMSDELNTAMLKTSTSLDSVSTSTDVGTPMDCSIPERELSSSTALSYRDTEEESSFYTAPCNQEGSPWSSITASEQFSPNRSNHSDGASTADQSADLLGDNTKEDSFNVPDLYESTPMHSADNFNRVPNADLLNNNEESLVFCSFTRRVFGDARNVRAPMNTSTGEGRTSSDGTDLGRPNQDP